MKEKPLKPPNIESLFRYSVLSEIIACALEGHVCPDVIERIAAQQHVDLNGAMRKISSRTLYRWHAAFEEGGIEALEPLERTGQPVALSQDLLDFFKAEKLADPRASIPELIRRAQIIGHITPGEKIVRSTVWRNFQRMGIPTDRIKTPKVRDCRRFSYPHRMDMVLSDGKHFRVGTRRLKRVAMFFVDDATRFVLEVVVGTSENTELFLRGLYLCIESYGVMISIFVDNGSGFKSLDTIAVAAKLNVHLIHGTAGYPEGHGKIERFNRTVLEQAIRQLVNNPEIDPETNALELRLRHFVRERYNKTPHASLGGATPWERFHQDSRTLRFHDNTEKLRNAFVLHQERRVSKDHVVSVDGIAYETPRGYARKRVMLYRHLLDQTVSLLHDGRLIRLAPVDVHANAKDRRAINPNDPPVPLPPPGAAQLAFDKDFSPVVDADGGVDIPKTEKGKSS